MLLETVNLDWIRDRQFVMRDRNGFPIFMDQPNGINASDLLPLSLAGCTSYDVIAILEKQRQDVTDLSVTTESTRDPEPPWAFRKIHLHYKVGGRGLQTEKIFRAIELAEQKYCGIYATLKDVVEITSDFEIIDMEKQKDGS
jgi:putative redox protein